MLGIILEIGILVLLVVTILLLVKWQKQISAEKSDPKAKIQEQIAALSEEFRLLASRIETQGRETKEEQTRLRTEITTYIATLGDSLRDEQAKRAKEQQAQLQRMELQFSQNREEMLVALEKIRSDNMQSLEKMRRDNQESLDKINGTVRDKLQSTLDSLRDEQVKRAREQQTQLLRIEQEFAKSREGTHAILEQIRLENAQSMSKMRLENAQSLEKMRHDNQESLDKINGTVHDKLQKTLDDKISKSFAAVNERLAEVYAGLGEMKNVASGVSDLKNVLSNVKTRGIMGEIQLGSILDEILAPEQYGEQVELVSGSKRMVDFAVRLPGATENETVYLPIDAKFPGDSYANLLSAYEGGNPEEVKHRRSLLISEIKSCAKSIHDKYIEPPYTTDFAIMFLPFEGLYAEVVNLGLVEQLQRDYKINIAGPSTMAAMLNSLQMGFRTLAIQKKSGEVWRVLESTKKEFTKFAEILEKTRDRLRKADEDLDKLVGVRTRAINRQLQEVQLNEEEAPAVLSDHTGTAIRAE